MLAAMMHNNITHEDIKGWLFTSAPRRAAGKLLEIDKFGRQIKDGKLAANIETAIIRRKPDLVSLDPFVKTHSVGENENTLIDEVAQILTDLGAKHNIAIDAPHHVSKGTTDPGNADKGRGASSLVDAARLVKTLTQMSADEARAFGIPQEDRKQYVRVDNGKVNLSRSGGAAQWFELIGVAIGNGNDRYPNGDIIQVAKPWKPPEIWSDLPEVLLNKILDKIDEGMADGERYIDLASAKKRAAWPIVVGMAPHKTEEQAKQIIRAWLNSGVLVREDYHSEKDRKDVKGLVVNAAKRPGTVVREWKKISRAPVAHGSSARMKLAPKEKPLAHLSARVDFPKSRTSRAKRALDGLPTHLCGLARRNQTTWRAAGQPPRAIDSAGRVRAT